MFAQLSQRLGKDWYKSRGLWLGVISGLIGTLELVHDAVVAGDFSTPGIIMLVMGVLKVWERVTRSV